MDDKQIIHLFFLRNEDAIAETSKKYGNYLKSISYNILKNVSDVQECENDTYMAAWSQIPPTKPHKLSVFLGRIIRNLSLDKHNYYTAQKRNSEFDLVLSELEYILSSPETTESKYEEGEVAKYISEFLEKTEYTKRVVFIRRYWYCDSITDIASKYEMSESKVKSLLFRLRNKLKIYLKEKGVMI